MRMVWSSFYDYTVKLSRFAQVSGAVILNYRLDRKFHLTTIRRFRNLSLLAFVIFVLCVLNCPVPNLAF
jgi:hypothetical protein